MSSSPTSWQGFVYAEDRDGSRSLGFKLLAPMHVSWSAEVETLARKLHGCPYPETWKPAELFCSVLLEDGQRLIALARYGVRDNTASQRGGGLELLGAVGPAATDPEQSRAIAHWFRGRRADVDDPRSLAGPLSLDALPPAPALASTGFLSLRLPSTATMIITGAAPEQPDQNLGFLEHVASPAWQWLPYCGPDFPFEQYARRGPLVAWVPAHADLAVVLNRPTPEAVAAVSARQSSVPSLAMLFFLILVALNSYAWWSLPERLPAPQAPIAPAPPEAAPRAIETRERFADALYRLAAGKADGQPAKDEEAMRPIYERLVRTDPDLRSDAAAGQALVALVSQLASFHPDRVARIIREEFADRKGFDPEAIQIISERVKQRLQEEIASAK